MHIIAKTPRLIIRNFHADEQGIYMSLFDDEEVIRYLPKRTTDEHIQIFRQALADYADGKALGRWGMFTADGSFAGFCILRRFDDETARIEVGYAMPRKYWGMGLATEMAKAMLTYGFGYANATEIVAVTAVDNKASQKVLEKAGLLPQANIIRYDEELAYFKLSRPVDE